MDITVYLPDEIGERAKAEDLPFSQLLRGAVQDELERRDASAKLEGDMELHEFNYQEGGIGKTARLRGKHLASGPHCDVYVTADRNVVVHYHQTDTIDPRLEEPAEELRDLLPEDDYVEAVTALGLRPIVEL